MLPGPVRFGCWTCEKVHDIRELLADDPPLLPDCCRKSLASLTAAFSKALMTATLNRLKKVDADGDRLSDKLADIAVTSDDPELKKLGQRWRNRTKR